eukprot:GHVU01181601.1.p4 GENE.GHVU01181601.1~~GHVU01181601.1.p4  ORF type:complete len:138 (-),score=16.00 GHVU01181601.1:3776-4189(-)
MCWCMCMCADSNFTCVWWGDSRTGQHHIIQVPNKKTDFTGSLAVAASPAEIKGSTKELREGHTFIRQPQDEDDGPMIWKNSVYLQAEDSGKLEPVLTVVFAEKGGSQRSIRQTNRRPAEIRGDILRHMVEVTKRMNR